GGGDGATGGCDQSSQCGAVRRRRCAASPVRARRSARAGGCPPGTSGVPSTRARGEPITPRNGHGRPLEPEMSTLPITDAFAKYLMDERHFSPYTARCYGADLRQSVEFLAAENGVEVDQGKEA